MQFTQEDLDRTLESRRTAVSRLAATLLELDAERERRALEAQGQAGGSATAWARPQKSWCPCGSRIRSFSEKLAAVEAERAARPLSRDASDEDRLVAASARNAVGDLRAVRQAGADSRDHDLHMGGSRPGFAAARRDRAPVWPAPARQPGEPAPACRTRSVSLRDRLQELRRQVTHDPLSVPPEELAELTGLAERVCAEVDASAARVEGAAAELDRLSRQPTVSLDRRSSPC